MNQVLKFLHSLNESSSFAPIKIICPSWNVSLPFGLWADMGFFTQVVYWNIATARVWKRPCQRRDQTVTSLQFKDWRFDKNAWKIEKTRENVKTVLKIIFSTVFNHSEKYFQYSFDIFTNFCRNTNLKGDFQYNSSINKSEVFKL